MENEIIQTNDTIRTKILVMRGQQVMIDRDLAELYGVETKRLNEQVKRNAERFPENFCFQLNETEFENWRSQFATSNSDKMGLRRPPYAFHTAKMHDRFLIIDDSVLYHVGASLKDLGKKCFAFEILDSALIPLILQNV